MAWQQNRSHLEGAGVLHTDCDQPGGGGGLHMGCNQLGGAGELHLGFDQLGEAGSFGIAMPSLQKQSKFPSNQSGPLLALIISFSFLEVSPIVSPDFPKADFLILLSVLL